MIYHLFPGNMEHHTPPKILFFIQHHHRWHHDPRQYRFAVFGTAEENKLHYARLPLASGQLIFLPASHQALFHFLGRLTIQDSLVMHSTLIPWIWFALLANLRLWNRTAWIMWGADINRQHTLKGQIYGAVRSLVIPRLGAISALVPGDYDLMQRNFGPADNYVRAIYPYDPAIGAQIHEGNGRDKGHRLRVMLGNSGWDDNQHPEALGWLARFADRRIEVVCPLGYPADSAYKRHVIALGTELFGERFIPIREVVPRDEYWKITESCDVLILNNRNQQGLGNIYYMAFNGKKIYLHPENPTTRMLQTFGIQYYNACDLATLTFEELAVYSSDIARHNLAQAMEYLSLESSFRGWGQLFERIGATPAAPSAGNLARQDSWAD